MYDRISSKEKKSFGITGKRFGTATAVRTDIFPGFSHNRVPGLGLSSGLDEKTLVEIKKFYEGSKNIYALQLVPHILNNETKELLERQGFVFKKNWVRFYRDVSPIENVRTDLVVKQVGKQYADTYGEILTRIFDFPRELACTMTSVMEAENWKHFMAFDGEKPVTTGSVYSGSDTAWIGFAATEPTHRGRGGQAAVLAARINAAREHGCKWISVETAEETAEHDAPSYRNMLRYGFRLLYKRPNYVFTP
jgi:GNAT superfamily N-acetyltransferase